MGAMLESLGESVDDMKVAIEWEDLRQWVDKADKGGVKEGDWIFVDRIDLAWNFVQRWYTLQKYQQELAEQMLQKAKEIKKSFMFVPRFDQGAWQVINENFESFMLRLLYKYKCNVVMTAGIRGLDDNNPIDIFGLGVLPRGQKELPHQPHSVFLLQQQMQRGKLTWVISTCKDLPKRKTFDHEVVEDFALEYLSEYVKE